MAPGARDPSAHADRPDPAEGEGRNPVYRLERGEQLGVSHLSDHQRHADLRAAGVRRVGFGSFPDQPALPPRQPARASGETREERIREYVELRPDVWVVGLRESAMLRIEDDSFRLIGDTTCRVFRKGMEPRELGATDSFEFLRR